MYKNGFLKLLKFLCLVMLISSCNSNNNNGTPTPGGPAPTSQKIAEITAVQIEILKSNPPQLSISAKGNVTTSGWSKPELVPFIYVAPPQDGIYDFDFRAVPPAELSAQVITPIEVTHSLNPLPDNLKGVRIHGTQNNKVTMLED